jgi:hypothetical protein
MLNLALQKAEFPPWTFAVFCLASGIGMAIQTFLTYRSGFMYCGRSLRTGTFLRVYKKEEPVKYRVWFGIQLLLVTALFGASALGFWIMVHTTA